jgi:hypothetical protein
MGRMVYAPRLLALSSLRRCMVRTILLGGFYLWDIRQRLDLEALLMERASVQAQLDSIRQWGTYCRFWIRINERTILETDVRSEHTGLDFLEICWSVAVRELRIDFEERLYR